MVAGKIFQAQSKLVSIFWSMRAISFQSLSNGRFVRSTKAYPIFLSESVRPGLGLAQSRQEAALQPIKLGERRSNLDKVQRAKCVLGSLERMHRESSHITMNYVVEIRETTHRMDVHDRGGLSKLRHHLISHGGQSHPTTTPLNRCSLRCKRSGEVIFRQCDWPPSERTS